MPKTTKKDLERREMRSKKRERILRIAQIKKANQQLSEEERLTNKRIGELLGLSGERVRQIWNEVEEIFNWADEPGISAEERELRLSQRDQRIDEVVNKQCQKRGQRVITPEIAKRIEELFEEEKERDELFGPNHKQHLNGKLIHKTLESEGFENVPCYGTINAYFKELKNANKKKEAFIEQVHQPGQRLEMDLGYIDLEINGEVITNIPMIVFTLPWSNFRWACLLKDQTRETIIAKIIEVLHIIGAVPEVIVTDNLKQIVVNPNAQTDACKFANVVMELAYYYDTRFMACQPARGNQKGNVEISVKVIRTDCFTTFYKFNSFEEAQRHLQEFLERTNDKELLAQEVEKMKPIRALPYNPFQFQGTRTVENSIKIEYDNGFYSVPNELIGEEVEVYTSSTHLRAFYNGVQVAEHLLVPKEEQDKDKRYRVDYRHYHGQLTKKAGSLLNSRLILSNPDLQDLYITNFKQNSKLFIQFLEDSYPEPPQKLRWMAQKFLDEHSTTSEKSTPEKTPKPRKQSKKSQGKKTRKSLCQEAQEIEEKTSQELNELDELVLGDE